MMSDADSRPAPSAATDDDATLGGYLRVHDRPPAFEGADGYPYTVSPEVERTGDLRAPFHAYLVFPRWARTGAGIVGHVESETLFHCRSMDEAERSLGDLELTRVRAILDDAVARAEADEPRTN